MKHCTQCSREYPGDPKFCTQCGLPLADGPAEPAAASEAPVEPAVEAVAEAEASADSAAEADTAAESPAEPVSGEVPAVVEAAPAVIEVILPASGESAAPAVAVAEAPPAPPVSAPQEPPAPQDVSATQEPPAPQEKIRRGGEKISAIRKIGAFFLCIPLFLFLLIPAVIYQVRDTSTEAWLSNYLDKVSLSDQIDLDEIGYAIEEWLQELDPELEDVELDLREAGSEIDRFIRNAKIREFAARQLAAYLNDIYSGASSAVLTEDDISGLMDDNSALINDQLSEMVDELFGADSGISIRLTRAERADLAERIFGELEDSGAYAYLHTNTLREELPALYYTLRFGLSYIAAGLSLILAAAIFFCLAKTLKSALRAANRAGIVLIVLGGLLTLLALVPKMEFLSEPWLRLFNDADILALFAGDFLYTHLIVDLGILGAGVLLTAATGLALMIRKKRAAQ